MQSYQIPATNSYLRAMSLYERGTFVTDLDVILQRLHIVLRTPFGSDPLRPFSGCDIINDLDDDTHVASASIKNKILTAAKAWVPELQIYRIKDVSGTDGSIVFYVYATVDGKLISPIAITKKGGLLQVGITTSVIVDARYVLNSPGLLPVLTINGKEVQLPAVPVSGFDDEDIMLEWVKDNWGTYGAWTKSKDFLILYANPE